MRPLATQIPLDADAGLDRDAVSFANAIDIRTVLVPWFARRTGVVSVKESQRRGASVRLVLGLIRGQG